jgi:hypothetical protein
MLAIRSHHGKFTSYTELASPLDYRRNLTEWLPGYPPATLCI